MRPGPAVRRLRLAGWLRRAGLCLGLAATSAMAMVGAAADAGVGLATDATELSARLMAGREPATLEEQQFERGCHGEVCAMTWQDLVFSTAPGGIRRVSGGALRVVSHGASEKRPLPDLDWEPLAGYAVSVAGQRWGSCFELAHAGLGKSGAAQRWTSVMLLAQTATEAHRFVGYLTGCDALLRTAEPTELELPMVTRAPGTQTGLRVERQVCSATACRVRPDARRVQRVADDPAGALRLTAPR